MAAQTQPPSDNIWVGDLPPGLLQPDLAQLFEQYGEVVSCRMMPPKAEGQKACAMVKFASVEIAQWVVESLNGNIAQGLEEPIICRFANAPGWKEQMQAQKGGGGGWQNGKGGGGGWQNEKGGGGGWQNGSQNGGGNRWQPYDNEGGGGGWGKSAGKGKSNKGGKGGSFYELFGAVKKSELFGGQMKLPEECTVYVKNLPADTTDLDLFKLFAPFGAIAPTGVKAMKNPDGSCQGYGFVDFVDPAAAATAVVGLGTFRCPDGSTISVSQKLPSKKAQGQAQGNVETEEGQTGEMEEGLTDELEGGLKV